MLKSILFGPIKDDVIQYQFKKGTLFRDFKSALTFLAPFPVNYVIVRQKQLAEEF